LHPVCGHAQAISGVFSVASHSALQYFGKSFDLSTAVEKQTIFAQGNSSDAVFYIQEGKVKLTVVSKIGTCQTQGDGSRTNHCVDST
jgi:hypothetical protein